MINQKGFASIIILGIAVVVLLGVVGYFILNEKQATPLEVHNPVATQSDPMIPRTIPIKLDAPKEDPAPPADQALAEITVLSQTSDELKLRIDNIRDYIRYPAATNPQLKTEDTISIHFNGQLDTFQDDTTTCPVGYVKNPKPAHSESGENLPGVLYPQPKITVGEKYLSKLIGCFAQANCQTIGWSGWLYNPSPTVVEHECVQGSTTPPPSVNPQGGYPSVQPQQ